MIIDVRNEIAFTTTRSGGKGGQNVNKVETAVIAAWEPMQSTLLDENQKQLVLSKLNNRLTKSQVLVVRSQTYRTQLENKEDAIKKINQLLAQALHKKKARIATKASKSSIEKRLNSKKRQAELKAGRAKNWQ